MMNAIRFDGTRARLERVAVPEAAASVSTAPRMGPMHGDQATANAVPIAKERG